MGYWKWRAAYKRKCDLWLESPEFERAVSICAPYIEIVHNDSPYQDDLPWFDGEEER